MRKGRRNPKNYDGVAPTGHSLGEILPSVLRHIGEVYQDRPDLILAAWPEIIGERLASMTQAVRFVDGLLWVKVKNSTLLSLLSTKDRPRLLKSLRSKFPKVPIKNIVFRIG